MLPPPRIFIVEDEFVVAKDLQRQLERLGYVVCGRANAGEKALELLATAGAEIVLMDIVLNGTLNGIETAAIIRRRFHLPVIYITANTDAEVLEHAKVTEPFGFIIKPFTARELQINIEIALYKHRTEQTLSEQKTLLDEVFQGVQEGIAVVDEWYAVVFCNPAYEQLVESPPGNLLGQSVFAFFEQTERSFLVKEMKARQPSRVVTYELPLVTLQGHRKFVRLTVAPRIDQDGRVSGELVTMLDITARKRVEDELNTYKTHLEQVVEHRTGELVRSNKQLAHEIAERQRMEEQLRQQSAFLDEVFNGIQEGIGIVDAQENILFCNAAYARIFEEPVAQLHGANLLQFFDEANRAIIRQQTVLRQRGERSVYELVLMTKQGKRKDIHVSIAPRFSATGEYIGAFGVILDLTARKHTERALLAAKDAAEAANRAKTEFLANMNHELRTPLNGILGYAQLLREAPNLTEPQRAQVQSIQQSGEHLLTIFNDLLDISKIEAGQLTLETHQCHLPQALRSLVNLMTLRAKEKGLALHYEPDLTLPEIVALDAQRLRQILLNLLGNAIKFTSQGQVTLRVKKVNTPDLPPAPEFLASMSNLARSVMLCFEVEDTGIGIPAEHLPHIFLPFSRLHDPLLYTEGTGLGLSISRRLVQMMGSELQVASQIGQGSCFWFYLKVIVSTTEFATAPLVLLPEPAVPNIPCVPPPRYVVRHMLDLALVGDILGIRAQLEEFAQVHPEYEGFIGKLRPLVNLLQISKIRDLLTTLERQAEQSAFTENPLPQPSSPGQNAVC